MTRRTAFAAGLVALALVTATPAAATDAQILSARLVGPGTVEVRLTCQRCPPVVAVELIPAAAWTPDGDMLPVDRAVWRPVVGSAGSAALRIRATRTVAAVPAFVDLQWGREVGLPPAYPGAPRSRFDVEGSAFCVLLGGQPVPPEWEYIDPETGRVVYRFERQHCP